MQAMRFGGSFLQNNRFSSRSAKLHHEAFPGQGAPYREQGGSAGNGCFFPVAMGDLLQYLGRDIKEGEKNRMTPFLVLGAYLLGSIPFGLVLGKAVGIDVRRAGSGNIGATNVARLAGKKLGALTLLLDAGKALAVVLAASWLLAGRPDQEQWVALCGAAAFLGHLYPVYLGFRGGKGVATALGLFLYLEPLATLGAAVIFIGVVYNWGYVSLGSLTAALLLPGLIWLISASVSHALLAVFAAGLIWLKHRDNIVRLMRQQEKSWRKKD